jgi:hypothetical protein
MSLQSFFGEPSDLEWFIQGNEKATGLTIGYRRVAGKIGLTSYEEGIRGAWVDKRVAMFKKFQADNYKIILLSDTTESTKGETVVKQHKEHYDILCLEFGGTNLQFYGNDWELTTKYVDFHKGPVWFLCDDPDLSFLWNLTPNEDWNRWTILANAVNAEATLQALKAPDGVKFEHIPMDKYMEADSFNAGSIPKVVYIGRNQGRSAYFKTFGNSPYLRIAGKAKEWEDYPEITIVDVPQQKNRRKFYRDYYGCLAIYDKKHKETGWHTGRAYHALYAGIPVLAPPGNSGLDWCYPVSDCSDIEKFIDLSVEERQAIWQNQLDKVRK